LEKLSKNSPSCVQPGVFVQPSGAQLRSAPDEEALALVWDEVRECVGYPKPDGWRIQIHKQGNDVQLFSRSGKNWTKEFPDVVNLIRAQVQVDQVILDTEIVGFDRQGQHLGPSKLRYAHQYRCYLLDALYLKGQDLTLLPTRERVPLIWEHLSGTFHGSFTLAEYTSIKSESEFITFYQKCRARKAEGFDGLIIKQLDTLYFTDVLKVKPEETVDAVVVGAERNLSGAEKTLLLAVPCRDRNSWVPIAKVARTSIDWQAVWSACEPHILEYPPDNLEEPPGISDIWIAPKVVVTVSVTEWQPSKAYLIHGFGARDCVLREDKSPQEATSFEQVLQMAGLSEIPEPRQKQQQLSFFGRDCVLGEDKEPQEAPSFEQVLQMAGVAQDESPRQQQFDFFT
jgi:ATP-dependent DNA ligase